jgi:transcriptional regulator of nitric oxide reductase
VHSPTQRQAGQRLNLEPASFIGDVGVDKILVTFGEVNDALDETDYSADAAGEEADDDLDDAFLGVAEDEFMDSQAAQQNAKDSAQDLLVCSGYFFAHSFLGLNLRGGFNAF